MQPFGSNVTEKMGSRIDNLLGLFSLEDRRGTKANSYTIPSPMDSPDWSNVDKYWKKSGKRSAEYFERVFIK